MEHDPVPEYRKPPASELSPPLLSWTIKSIPSLAPSALRIGPAIYHARMTEPEITVVDVREATGEEIEARSLGTGSLTLMESGQPLRSVH